MPPYNRKHYKQSRQATVIDNVGGLASKRYDCNGGNGFAQKIAKRRVKAAGESGKEPKDSPQRTEGAERKRTVDPCLDDVGLIT